MTRSGPLAGVELHDAITVSQANRRSPKNA